MLVIFPNRLVTYFHPSTQSHINETPLYQHKNYRGEMRISRAGKNNKLSTNISTNTKVIQSTKLKQGLLPIRC